MSQRRLKAYVLLLLATVIWSVAGPVIKFTLSEISPFNFLTYRFGISAIISLGLILGGELKLPKKRVHRLMLVACGLLGNTIALGLLFVGLNLTTVLDTSIIEATIPLVVGLLGVKFLHDRITKREKLGTAVAMMGTLITILGPLGGGGVAGQGYERFIGNALILLFILSDSTSFILAKKLTHNKVKSTVISNYSFIIGFLTVAPIALMISGWGGFWSEVRTLPYSHHLGVWYMAIFSGSLAYWLWTKGQKTIEVSEAAVFRYLIPVFSAPIAIGWLKESLTVHYVLGAAVIAVGVAVAEYKALS